MSSELAVNVQGLSKMYRIFARPEDRLKQMFFGRWRKYHRDFWALRDVSFNLEKGKTFGIVGRNGSGKSTLLQLLCKTVAPTSGSLFVNGRVSALLELGTGFNPEFSGKENVFLNATILGLKRQEIEEKYDEIVNFADIGEFLDQPVKTYSSGMYVRLAFSVAINVDPEILIVDEALSVGDVKFQAKCFRKFEEFKKSGKTIIFVSHSPEEIVRHCDSALLLEQGSMTALGEPRSIVNQYLDILFGSPTASERVARPSDAAKDRRPSFLSSDDNCPARPGYNKLEYRWGDKRAEIVDYELVVDGKPANPNISNTELVDLLVKVKFNADISRPIYGLAIKTPDGVTIYGTNSRDWDGQAKFVAQKQGDEIVVKFSLVPKLVSGPYLISLGVVDCDGPDLMPLDRRYDLIEIQVRGDKRAYGLVDLDLKFSEVA